MIHITDKRNCCGCTACVQRCPKHCIFLEEDQEGFLYPKVNIDDCINCGLCEKVCPIINKYKKTQPIETLAAINENNEIRFKSSSGGIFSLLANNIIEKGGIVFGATFDEKWNVNHISVKEKNDLFQFMGSKYLQSLIKETYLEAEAYLKQGILVLFSGTLCQIAGLKHFLGKSYDNLITIDCLCHGVPSPKVWQLYLKELLTDKIGNIKTISFRDKKTGWKNYSFTIQFTDGTKFTQQASKNVYMRGFLSHLYLRPSCENCPSKSGRSGSDLTIADYWGVNVLNPDMDDDKGTSLILVNTEKGKRIFEELKCTYKPINLHDAIKNNSGFNEKAIPHKKRKYFFERIGRVKLSNLIKKCLDLSFIEKIKLIIYKARKIKY